jgi:hypothetical protein
MRNRVAVAAAQLVGTPAADLLAAALASMQPSGK